MTKHNRDKQHPLDDFAYSIKYALGYWGLEEFYPVVHKALDDAEAFAYWNEAE